ncbi:MAG: hypothetical protein U9R53_02125 [Chloroflexota bacterium]|nr:hypothetical protein [Chloroflexota bacterium]
MPRKDEGCQTPVGTNLKDIYKRLLTVFCPILHFHPDERFFPVDLRSTISNSALWKYDPNVDLAPSACTKIINKGQINNPSVDLLPTTADHFTTVTDMSWFDKQIEGQPTIKLPEPKLDKILQVYRDEIQPELTIYGMVCKTRETPNIQLLINSTSMRSDVHAAVAEGYLLTYYFYFPAYESKNLASEGDWSGIALLIKALPNSFEDLKNNITTFEPLLSCYFRKTSDGYPPSPLMVAQPQGIRRWQDVTKTIDTSLNHLTHPKVFISKGRHNCYYTAFDKNISSFSPWRPYITSDDVEDEKYSAGPVDNTIVGETDWGAIPWYAYVLFPPLALFVACASGCEYPAHFDSSGVPPDNLDDNETTDENGYDGLPSSTGTSYPNKPASQAAPGQRNISLKLTYVDLSDPDFSAIWHCPGAWGSATIRTYGAKWGYIQGVRRPLLAAWFNFNLFVDYIYGAGGTPELTPSP